MEIVLMSNLFAHEHQNVKKFDPNYYSLAFSFEDEWAAEWILFRIFRGEDGLLDWV